MTLYRLYAQNGDRAGFWVQHRTWHGSCAFVQSVAGQQSGRLPGLPPLHDNAPAILKRFDIRSGRPTEVAPLSESPADRAYVQIAEPSWSKRADRGQLLREHPAVK